MNRPARLAVFASGGGTNLQALLDRFNAADSPVARVELVIGSREGIGALQRAERFGVMSRVLDPAADPALAGAAMMDMISASAIDLIVLAGYLRLVPAEVVQRYRQRIVNIHPALLPSFGGPGMYGMRVHRAVLASGARVSGATAHLVDERYDEGPIIAQWPVPVLPGDTEGELAARVLKVEHLLLPAAIEYLATGVADPASHRGSAFELIDAPAPPMESVRRFIV